MNGWDCYGLTSNAARMQADFWRSVYPAVTPGYHMNKVHWNTITLDGSMTEDEICEMIAHSYEQVRDKGKKCRK